ncbi:MAG: Wzz/FepE/Etk N-terminal domain-containing protein [Burkholderiaceae bacterium]
MTSTTIDPAELDPPGPAVTLADLLTWLGQGKRLIGIVTVLAALAAVALSLAMTPTFTARATLLPPQPQQAGGSAAALAALGSLSGLGGGFGAKTPDELYVALLRSDSVQRALAERYDLMTRYEQKSYEALRKAMPSYIHIIADKKSGLIVVEVDDRDPKFAADLANAHTGEITKVLGRLAVSEAQLRRVFFEKQLKDTKEALIAAEQALRRVQETSGVIALDKQAESLIVGAATVRAQISDREVQLKVLRGSATEQNPDVIRLASELRALRAELARMESTQGGNAGSAVDLPVGRLPEASIDYVRARRELKLQETLLEGMIRQFEIAKLDEAKEGPVLQQVDVALPPDRKSKPARALIVLGATLFALLASMAYVIARGYGAAARALDPGQAAAWQGVARAWRLRG